MTESGGMPRGAPLVKICGLTRNEDARFAQKAGADYVGVVLSQGFGRSVPEGDGERVLEGVTVPRVAVTVDESPEINVALARSIGASVIQLHGSEPEETARVLKNAGAWSIWKAVRAREVADVQRVMDDFGEMLDGVLVEGWRDGAIGGAGLTLGVDPAELNRVLTRSVSFVLAGGLTPESVADYAARFGPDVVDVSSGVERERGLKDPDRVEAFIRAARSDTLLGRTDLNIERTP